VVSVTPRPRFTPGKEHLEPISEEAGWVSDVVDTTKSLKVFEIVVIYYP
jgi:hypothetical protein